MSRAIGAIVVALAVGLAPTAAAAPDTTIDFEDLAPGTPVADSQYAAQGVTFNHDPSGSFDDPMTVVSVGSVAHSGTQAARISNCGTEFCTNSTWGRFDITHQRVSAYVGDVGELLSHTVYLTGYDTAGRAVATAAGAAPHDGTSLLLSAESTQRDIAFFSVTLGAFPDPTRARNITIDDLSFDNPDVPPPPDFGLVRPDPAPVDILPGQTRKTNIVIRRVNGSRGDITFEATAKPPGVDVDVAPNPQRGGDGSTVEVTMTARASAPPFEGEVEITGTPDATSGTAPRKVRFPILVDNPRRFDVRLRGIEVTQGIQLFDHVLPSEPFGQRVPSVPYQGVPLSSKGKTIVRVWADAPSGAPVRQHEYAAVLHAYRNGRELRGSPIGAEDPRALQGGKPPNVTLDERLDRLSALSFVLPPDWAIGTIDLRAELLTPKGTIFAGDRLECRGCQRNNSLGMTGVKFTATPQIVIGALQMVVQGKKTFAPLSFPSPGEVFERAFGVHPGGEHFRVTPYLDTLDVTEIENAPNCTKGDPKCKYPDKNDAYLDLVSRWVATNRLAERFDLIIGVAANQAGSWAGSSIYNLPIGNPDRTVNPQERSGRNAAFVNYNRPLTSVAHELGHDLGRAHASPACNGNGEAWPPDNRGYIQGVGLDRRYASGGAAYAPGIYSVFGLPNQTFYDVMSYCANESDAWISVSGWTRELKALHRYGIRTKRVDAEPGEDGVYTPAALASSPRAAQSAEALLHVEAIADSPTSGRIAALYPVDRHGTAGSPSGYDAVVRDDAGAILARTPMEALERHSHEAPGGLRLSADVPSAGADSVEVEANGVTLASRRRSAHAPSARLLRVGTRARRVPVSWRASDADGDALLASLDYSADGGRSWRTVFSGPNRGKASLPHALLPRARRGRLRLRVDDGFSESAALSRRFASAGAPPVVHILSPPRGLAVSSASAVYLSGEAFDDRADLLGEKRPTWFVGRRRVARGATAKVIGLPPGRRRIRLVARDRFGRRSSAAVTISVRAVAPAFLKLEAPASVGRHRRRLRLRVQSSQPALLSIRGGHVRARRVRVSHRTRAIVVRVAPGRGPLLLRLSLSAGGKTTARSVLVTRG